MASKARKERRRVERERARDWANLPIDQHVTQELQHEAAFVDDTVPTLVEVVHHDELPPAIERMKAETEQHGATYEEANWAKLAPHFRDAHNRLRQLRGLPSIPPPAIDLYRPPAIRRADPKELEAIDREQRAAKAEFLGRGLMGPRTPEGFTINGEDVKF
jgi:hypothetical protein